jgi:hypothetical protein
VRLTITEAGAARVGQWRDIRTDLAIRAIELLPDADRQVLAAAVPVLTCLARRMAEL